MMIISFRGFGGFPKVKVLVGGLSHLDLDNLEGEECNNFLE